MATYTHLTTKETIAMTLIVVASLLAGIPALYKVFKKKTCNFLGAVFLMSLICSFFYHICEIYDYPIFLDKLQWQRMDNVFTISSVQLVLLFLCGCLHEGNHYLEYSCLFNTILIQEKDPWNFNYTIYPILIYLIIGFSYRYFYMKGKYQINYVRKTMILSLLFLAIGAKFFFDGLDDENDYLRMSHGAWHISIGIFGWFAFDGVTIQKSRHQSYIFADRQPTEF